MKKLLSIILLAQIPFCWASEFSIDVDASYEVAGLVKPAEIIVDDWDPMNYMEWFQGL